LVLIGAKGPFEMLEEIGVENFFNKVDDLSREMSF
jgi:hypothetical protein